MATDLERLVVSIEANTSNIDSKLKALQSTVDNSMGGVERRSKTFTSNIESHFLSIGRLTRELTAGFAILSTIRFAESVVKDFDKIVENARQLKIAVDDDLVTAMHHSAEEGSKAWTELQLSVAAYGVTIEDVKEGIINLGRALISIPKVASMSFADIQKAQQDQAQHLAAQTAGIPFGPGLKFPAPDKTAASVLAEFAAREKVAKEQRDIDNENFAGTEKRRQKILDETIANNNKTADSDQELAEQQRQIDNQNLAGTEALRQKRLDEINKMADDTKKFLDDQAENAKRLNAPIVRALADDIANFGDAMDQAGGKFGKAVAGMVVDIGKLIVKLEIAKLIEDSLGKTGGGSVLGGIGSFIGSLFGPARAGGGSVYPGTAYPVGERGPEIFEPNVPGRIIPNGQGVGGQGGVSLNIVQHINGNGDAALAAVVKTSIVGALSEVKRQFPALLSDTQMRYG